MVEVTQTKIQGGVWHGLIVGSAKSEPQIEVTHEATILDDITLEQDSKTGDWALRIPIPLEVIADGIQTLIIRDPSTEEILGSFAILVGDALAQDMRAELELLRAELDLLKRAFRHHCADTGAT